jgi:hypothetical protein
MEFIKGYQLVVLPDNTAKLKGPDVAQLIKKYLGEAAKALTEGGRAPAPVARAVPAPAQPAAQDSASRLMQQRYGVRPSSAPAPTPVPVAPAGAQAAAPAPPSPAAIAAEIAALPTVVLAQGSWKGEGDQYELSMQAQVDGFKFDESKKAATVQASIKDGKLYLSDNKETMVLTKF